MLILSLSMFPVMLSFPLLVGTLAGMRVVLLPLVMLKRISAVPFWLTRSKTMSEEPLVLVMLGVMVRLVLSLFVTLDVRVRLPLALLRVGLKTTEPSSLSMVVLVVTEPLLFVTDGAKSTEPFLLLTVRLLLTVPLLVATLGAEITDPFTEVTLGFELTVLLAAVTLLLELREPFDRETVSFSWRVELLSTVLAVLLSVELFRVALELETRALLLSEVDWFWWEELFSSVALSVSSMVELTAVVLDLTTRVLLVRLSTDCEETLELLAATEVEWFRVELEESAARDEEMLEEFAWTDCEILVEDALRLWTETELLRVPLELLKDC